MALTKVNSILVDGAINTDASGNVGIGTTNPSGFRLFVSGGRSTFNSADDYAIRIGKNGTYGAYIGSNAADVLNFYDSSGNEGFRLNNQTLQMNNGYGSIATFYGCRAWVNFSGQGGAASIRASGNVSSVTENASSDYTINFTTAMPNTNYAITSWARGDDPSAADVYAWVSAPNAYAKTTSAMRIRCGMQQNGITYPNSESSEIGIAVFR
jgi:hypothetical protein